MTAGPGPGADGPSGPRPPIGRPTGSGWPATERSASSLPPRPGPPTTAGARPSTPPAAAAVAGAGARPAPARATTVGATRPVGGRRARLVVKRIDPWSMLKFAFVYSLAGMIVLLVAAIALYGIVDAMGVIDSIRSFLQEIEGDSSGSNIADWLGFGRVLTVALVVGIVNVILFTAFATLTAFVYNICTDLVGGVEVTLADRG